MRRVCACKRGGSRSSSPSERPIWPMTLRGPVCVTTASAEPRVIREPE